MRRQYELIKGASVLAYVAPGSVRYDMPDILFLLPKLLSLREGDGPVEPGSSYVGGKTNRKTANFIAWCSVAAEIDRRLAHVITRNRPGLDRWLVESHYCRGVEIEDLAIRIFMPTWEVRRRINSAVSYIASGECPRWLNCIDCPRYNKCSRRAHPPRKFKHPIGITYGQWVRSRSKRRKGG